LKIRGARVVWTVHDPVPHDMAVNARLKTGAMRLLWMLYRFVLVSCIDGLIFLSATHVPVVARRYRRLRHAPFVVTPHPHYRGVYPSTVSKAEARRRLDLPERTTVLAFIGKLRPYKNADGLLRAFKAYADCDARLLIAGEPDSAGYGATLADLARGDARITLAPVFVPDDRLQEYLNAADVVVLPFRDATNSGSLLLALSFDRAVAVPDIPVFREIQDLVGSDWVYLYQGELGPETLVAVTDWARGPRPASPPLDSLSWQSTATRTSEFYRSLIGT
jgi:glycosyltransferase involved in cell wall biosynthesis